MVPVTVVELEEGNIVTQIRRQEEAGYNAVQVGKPLEIASLFKEGDLVDVAGKSIGKGFQGRLRGGRTIKRWNFARGPMSHGSKSKRAQGSIGAGTTPGRVFKGMKMPGHMGAERVKIRKLEVIKVDLELGAILIKGGVPGKPGNILEICPAKIVGVNV
ncbi:hypothetical protein QBZ16_000870 [Prototheca wickerhamii]|uniref:Large ribosomal subunit protein uL3c n=1 Tax=Prototheca wickerhamii TaxID=3111 RepID=A0AAD9IFQ2_PROWI|nr:hypothetical protein QBZ16_000870 [Prototheca wickerhamii]